MDFVDTYSAGYRRNILLTNGGFDTSFPFASVEDQELSFRLAEAGHQMVFVPQGIVYHYHPESWLRYARRKYKIGYWKTLVLHLHPSKVWRDTHTPGDLKLQLILAAMSAPLALLSFWPRQSPVGAGWTPSTAAYGMEYLMAGHPGQAQRSRVESWTTP